VYDRWEYTIPANTAEADAIRVRCPVTKGFLRSLTVYFPPGCQNLARCRVSVGERPVAPRSSSSYIAADAMAVRIQYLNEPIWEDIPVLNWRLWNVDESYPHTVWMSAEWLSEEKPYEMKMAHQLEEFISLMRTIMGL